MFHSCKDTKFFRIVSHIGTDKYELPTALLLKTWLYYKKMTYFPVVNNVDEVNNEINRKHENGRGI
jgi:hypothetical protein